MDGQGAEMMVGRAGSPSFDRWVLLRAGMAGGMESVMKSARSPGSMGGRREENREVEGVRCGSQEK